MSERIIIKKDGIKDYNELVEALINDSVYLEILRGNYTGVNNQSSRCIIKFELVQYDNCFNVLAKKVFNDKESLTKRIINLVNAEPVSNDLSSLINIQKPPSK